MNPIISIGLYLASQVLLLSMANGALGNAIGERVFHNRRWLKILIAVVYMLLALLPVAGALLPDSAVKFSLQAGGNIWLGFYIYFGGTFIILSFIWQIVIWLTHKKSATISTGILTVSILAGVILLCYGMVHAKKTVVKNYDITIHKEAEGLKDLRTVLLADLHLSVNSDIATIENMVRMVNEENPDVIVIAGDIFTSTYAGLRNPDEYAAVLRELEAPYGVYAVYGNHDVEETLFGGFPISPIREAFRTKEMEQFFADYVYEMTGRKESQYEIMNKIAEKSDINSSHLQVSTLFSGTRYSPKERGSISHIDDTNFTPGNLIIGVLYGMSNELKSYFDSIGQKGITHIVASGNAVKMNPVLQKILGNTFHSSIEMTKNNEEAAIGSALFAGVLCGWIERSCVKDFIVSSGNEKGTT